MPNDAGLGGPIAYTAQPLPTTMTVVVPLLAASRIVPLLPYNFGGQTLTAIADGATVTATRQDAAGNATGEVVHDDRRRPYAVFAAAIAAGRWSFAVS